MAAVIRWRVWTTSPDEDAARGVLRQLLLGFPAEPLGLALAPYLKTDGHTFSFTTASEAERWADLVLEAITLGLGVGRDWSLSDDAESGLCGWSNGPHAPGALAVSWEVDRGALP